MPVRNTDGTTAILQYIRGTAEYEPQPKFLASKRFPNFYLRIAVVLFLTQSKSCGRFKPLDLYPVAQGAARCPKAIEQRGVFGRLESAARVVAELALAGTGCAQHKF